jgi:uncharacterized protein (DUF924 family)
MARRFTDVLDFWFPGDAARTPDPRRLEWWFRGGADDEILARFRPLFDDAKRGALDDWAADTEARLALILVLDQFSRTIHRGTADAFAQDAKALALARDGIEQGMWATLAGPWKQTFFLMPLGHSEDLAAQEQAVALTERLAAEAPPEQRALLAHSASQARGHRDVIARFGRHPHRNEVLGRVSTPEERAYVAAGAFVHTRPVPDLGGAR